MALIALEGMRFYAYHGFHQEEKELGGYYLIDVYIENIMPRQAFLGDLSKTVNYDTIYLICKMTMKKKTDLLEKLAARLVVNIRKQFPKVRSIKVRIKRENPSLTGEIQNATVELADDFTFTCKICKKPLVCFDYPKCWCIKNNINTEKLSNYQDQFYKCKCLDCPME